MRVLSNGPSLFSGDGVELKFQDNGLISAKTTIRTTTGGVPGISNEVQELWNDARAGTFTITFAGQTTKPLAYNASAAEIQTELWALSSIGPNNVQVTGLGKEADPWVVTFIGSQGKKDVPELATNDRGFGASRNTVTTTTEGNPASSEVQTLWNHAVSGFFTMSFRGATTGRLAYNAAAAEVQAALEALSTIGPNNVQVAGFGTQKAPWEIAFQGNLAGQDVPQIATDNAPDTITVSGDSFRAAGFSRGQKLVVTGTLSNDGAYTIAGLADDQTLTLAASDRLRPETAPVANG